MPEFNSLQVVSTNEPRDGLNFHQFSSWLLHFTIFLVHRGFYAVLMSSVPRFHFSLVLFFFHIYSQSHQIEYKLRF